MNQAVTVDVESFENGPDRFNTGLVLFSPVDDIEILFAAFDHTDNIVEQLTLVVKLAEHQAEIVVVELDPEARAMKVFNPARPQKAPPVFLDPLSQREFAQITTRSFTLDPFVLERFFVRKEPDAAALRPRQVQTGIMLIHGKSLPVTIALL